MFKNSDIETDLLVLKGMGLNDDTARSVVDYFSRRARRSLFRIIVEGIFALLFVSVFLHFVKPWWF